MAKTKKTQIVFSQGEQVAPKPLPGEKAVDSVLVQSAVQRINEIHRNKGIETARAIGEYLLDAFFDGDVTAFRSKGKKHASLRALAVRDDVAVSYTVIWYSIAVLEVLRQLPADIGAALPLSHHRLLVHVKDEDLRRELAEVAVEDDLTKRQLAEKIKALEAEEALEGKKAGRPALPLWAKSLAPVRKAIEAAAASEISDSEVREKGTKLVEARLAEVEATMCALEQLRAKLIAAIEPLSLGRP